ncbi:hypothetical protein FNV43_RR22614 [Rhamnella rubrinervis]|uniref:RING-type domain-containing protein n=1 Tax=Rhamnella rubrinervis TaxID=2594499 RepID=A0A8K0DXG1_9ROSA|nr:hypothetical protein FNV43_RR22614 [Rhamnella rubrinervis]
MTSAAELFYTRRSRLGRSADADQGFQSLSPDRNLHHNHTHNHIHSRRYRHNPSGHPRLDLDGFDPLRRSAPHGRHSCHRVSHWDRTALQLDEGASQFATNNRINLENFSSGSSPRFPENERLPGAVLLARARLLERLRGVPVPVSGRRPGSGRTLQIHGTEIWLDDDDDSSPVEARARRTEYLAGGSDTGFRSTDLSSETRILGFLQEPNKKPDGLTQEALNCLQLEVFSGNTGIAVGELVSKPSPDCSICLESFILGDNLFHLPCGHRFHAVCLDPWVRIRGDCPYCRRVIAVARQGDNRCT